MRRELAAVAVACAALLIAGGCKEPQTASKTDEPNKLFYTNFTESPKGNYMMARKWPIVPAYTFETADQMHEFIRKANKEYDVSARSGYVRNPGVYFVEIQIGDPADTEYEDKEKGELDKFAIEAGGIDAADGPEPLLGPNGIFEKWMPCQELVYEAGDLTEQYNATTDVTLAFSFENEEDANVAAQYFSDDYSTTVEVPEDGRYQLLVSRPMKYGDADHEADGAKEWVAAFNGRFEWHGAGYTER